MDTWQPAFDGYVDRVRQVFYRQTIVETMQAELTEIRPGHARVVMPYRPKLAQQHGALQAGIVSALADNACGCAALSLLSADGDVVAAEFKINFLSPAVGESFEAIGEVLKLGRTLCVCRGLVHAVQSGKRKAVAAMQVTLMPITNRPLAPGGA